MKESVNINYDSIKIQKYFELGKELADCLKGTVSKDIQSIFHHHVKEKSYVLQNTKYPSLGAIVISAHDIAFFTEDGKLRASITDFSKQKYDMKVSCKYLRDIFERTKSVDRLNSMVSQSQYAHCRIGLARKFLIQENHHLLLLFIKMLKAIIYY